MQKKLHNKYIKIIAPVMVASAIAIPTSISIVQQNNIANNVSMQALNANISSRTTTNTLKDNIVNTDYANYEQFDKSAVNVKPWKELVGTKGLLNIKESNDAGATLPYLYTPIDAQGNIGTLVEGELDFSSWGNFSKAYYSGGIYSETSSKFVTTISLFDIDLNKWVVFVCMISETGSDVEIAKYENLKTATLAGQMANMAYESETPFEFNVVPYFKTSTYSGSSDEYYLIYKYSINYYTTSETNSSFFKYDGNIDENGYSTDIFRTTVAIDASGSIKWDLKYMNQFKGEESYLQESTAKVNGGTGIFQYKRNKIIALRPVLYNNESNPVLAMITTPMENTKADGEHSNTDKCVISVYNVDGYRSTESKAIKTYLWNLTGDAQAAYAKETKNNFNNEHCLNFTPRYLDVFNTTGKSEDFNSGFMVSMLSRPEGNGSAFSDNYLINDLIGIKDTSSNDISNFGIANTQNFSYNLASANANIVRIWAYNMDEKTNRFMFYTNNLDVSNCDRTGKNKSTRNNVFSLDFSNIMAYNLSDYDAIKNEQEISSSNYTLLRNTSDFNTLLIKNFDDKQLAGFYTDTKYDTGSAASRLMPSFLNVNGSYFVNDLTTPKLATIETYIYQEQLTVNDTDFGELKTSMSVEEITTDQIKNLLLSTSSTVFKYNNVPITDFYASNYATDMGEWKKLLEVEKLETGYMEGVLSFKVKANNVISGLFENDFAKTLLQNQEGSADEFIYTIEGFKQTPETKLIPTTITATGYEEQLPSEVPTEDLKTIIEAQYSSLQDLFGDTVPPSVDSWEVVEPQINNDAGTITVGIQINSYYDATGKLINEPKTFPLTIDGFLKYHQPTQFPQQSTNLECTNPSDLTNQEIIDMVKGSITNLGDSGNNISNITISPETGPYENGQEITVTITGYYDENGKWNPGSKELTYIIKKKDISTNTNSDDIYWWIPLVAAISSFAVILLVWIIVFVILKKKRNE